MKAPEFQPKDQTKCAVEKSQERPLIVEWPSSDRMELETKARQGIVVVRYVGCSMDVLERCSVPAKYRYIAGTHKEDELDINDADDLYANLPVGAAKLEGTRRSFGFHGAYSLIALIFLCCSGLVITLPHHAPDPSIRTRAHERVRRARNRYGDFRILRTYG